MVGIIKVNGESAAWIGGDHWRVGFWYRLHKRPLFYYSPRICTTDKRYGVEIRLWRFSLSQRTAPKVGTTVPKVGTAPI